MRVSAVVTVAVLAFAPAASAQQKFTAVGPNECLNCHDHDDQRAWYEKKEIPEVQRLFPDKGANAGHINSLKQLETPKSNDFAKAIGLADKYDTKGACVTCHATVFAGDANAGVSCESCHGAASGYLKPHQTKGAYDVSVAQYGQTKLVGNIQGWTQQCTTCHIMDDDRLIKAGHPSGDDFDLGKRYAPVSLHFKKHAAADVAAIGKSEFDAILRRRRPGQPPAPAPPPAVTTSAAPVVGAAGTRARGASGRAGCRCGGRCASLWQRLWHARTFHRPRQSASRERPQPRRPRLRPPRRLPRPQRRLLHRRPSSWSPAAASEPSAAIS